MLCTVTGAAAVLLAAAVSGTQPAPPSLKPEQIKGLASRVLDRQPFLQSTDAREERQTLRRYFGPVEYEKLRGNPVLGYWDASRFRWAGRVVTWGGIVSAARSAGPISAQGWQAAFRQVAGRQGLTIAAAAPMRIEGACVAAVIDPSKDEPVPGVLLELRITSPAGVLSHRFGIGKPTVEEAMGAALDFAISFARTIGKEKASARAR